MNQNDEKNLDAIVALLESNVGYGIEFFGLTLSVGQLEDLRCAVSHEKYDSESNKFHFDFERIFDDANEAAKFFLQKRREFELGYNFESELEKL